MTYKEYKDAAAILCKQEVNAALAKGLKIAAEGTFKSYDKLVKKTTYAIGAKDLHRGVYCPSPVHEIIVRGLRRGRLIAKPTVKSNISNRYHYDSKGRLLIAETLFKGKTYVKKEYLVYEDNSVYGFSFGDTTSEISIERYKDGKLKSYLWACCYGMPGEAQLSISHMIYETFTYDDNGLLDFDYYYITPMVFFAEMFPETSCAVSHSKYRAVHEGECLVGYYDLQYDGTPFSEEPEITIIKKPKKYNQYTCKTGDEVVSSE